MTTNTVFSSLYKFSNLFVALSLRADNNMKIRADLEKDDTALAHREQFFTKAGLSSKEVVCAKLVHGSNVEIVFTKDKGQFISDSDGLITDQRGVYLSITVADCLPIVTYDSQKEILCLLHCGWGGLAKKIINQAVKKMQEQFEAKAGELVAGIGPGIGGCHFEVKEDVLNQFKEYPEALIKREDKDFVDLKMVAKLQLERAGVMSRNIEVSPDCTYCLEDKYFSYRRDKPKILQTMLFVVGMR